MLIRHREIPENCLAACLVAVDPSAKNDFLGVQFLRYQIATAPSGALFSIQCTLQAGFPWYPVPKQPKQASNTSVSSYHSVRVSGGLPFWSFLKGRNGSSELPCHGLPPSPFRSGGGSRLAARARLGGRQHRLEELHGGREVGPGLGGGRGLGHPRLRGVHLQIARGSHRVGRLGGEHRVGEGLVR